MSEGLLDERVRSVQPYSAEVLDNWARRLDHAFAFGAQNDTEGADQWQPECLSTAASFQVIENGTAPWRGLREGKDLRFSSSEIPGCNL